jgi:hypothetical protein
MTLILGFVILAECGFTALAVLVLSVAVLLHANPALGLFSLAAATACEVCRRRLYR